MVREGCEVTAVAPAGVVLRQRRAGGGGRGRARRGAVEPRARRGRRASPLPLEPRKGQLVRLAAPEPGLVRHKVVDGAYLRSVQLGERGLQVSTVVETTWEGDVLVGSSRERRGFDTSVDAGRERGDARARGAAVPARRGAAGRAAWAGLRPWLPDHLPAIGPSQRVPGLWLATGHEGAGVALGPVTGRLVAQLWCGEAPVVDPAPFDPDRFGESELRH